MRVAACEPEVLKFFRYYLVCYDAYVSQSPKTNAEGVMQYRHNEA